MGAAQLKSSAPDGRGNISPVSASPDPDLGSDGDSERLGGRLLVAAPQLADPNFTRTVVLVLEHDEPGAVGVVLNRPLQVEVGEILERWALLATAAGPGVVFSGGPVSPDAVIGMARRGDGPGESVSGVWRGVVPGVGVVDLSTAPADQPVPLEAVRLFSGYAGWAPGQLEAELEEDGWFVFEALASDVFTDRPEALWHDVLQRQGGRVSMLAAYPPSPSVN